MQEYKIPIAKVDTWKIEILNYLTKVDKASINKINKHFKTSRNKSIDKAINFLEFINAVMVKPEKHLQKTYRYCSIMPLGYKILENAGFPVERKPESKSKDIDPLKYNFLDKLYGYICDFEQVEIIDIEDSQTMLTHLNRARREEDPFSQRLYVKAFYDEFKEYEKLVEIKKHLNLQKAIEQIKDFLKLF